MCFFKKIFVVSLFLFLTHVVFAQENYKAGIGLRLGPSYGVTFKYFFTDNIALEGLLLSRYYGEHYSSSSWRGTPNVVFAGLAEWHFPVGNIDGFKWFLGAGLHFGLRETSRNNSKNNTAFESSVFGLDVIGGIEYTLSNAPFTFQADFKPSFHLIEKFGVWADELGASVRYTF